MKNFSSYRALGLSAFPCRQKKPYVGSWNKYRQAYPTEAELQAWDKTLHNIGVACGKLSGIVVIDLDSEDISLDSFPKTWTVKTSKGYHLYYRYPEGLEIGNKAHIGGRPIDIRGEGGYVIAPPSKHVSGHIYAWIDGRSPGDIELAPFPADHQFLQEKQHPGDHEAYIDAAIKDELGKLAATGEGGRNDALNKATFALAQFIAHGVSESYLTQELYRVAIMIGLDAKEARATIASGLKAGIQHPRELPEKPSPTATYRAVTASPQAAQRDEEIPDKLIMQAPGMLGSFIRWALETSLYPQPILALAASLPAVGVVMGHRAQTDSGFRTNFMTLGIAESGAGKEHARKCITNLYKYTGLSDHIVGDPASATAVINSVKRAGGIAMMLLDEFGRYLEAVNSPSAASHTKGITTNMMHLYNCADGVFTGVEYADNMVSGGRTDIDQPCLNIYATTVPHRYYGALTNEEAYDGFLSRWLVFETKRFDAEPRLDREPLGIPPEDLLDAVNYWKDRKQGVFIDPVTVLFDPMAKKAWMAYIRDCRAAMAASNSPVERAFLNRAAEHAAKIALAAHTGDKIDLATLEWSIELTSLLVASTARKMQDNISRSSYERELNKVRDFILSNPDGVRIVDVTRAFQNLDKKRRSDILETLLESGAIVADKDAIEGSRKKTTFLRSAQ